MTLLSTLSFALAMLVLAAIPGPGVMATVARSLSSGFRAALAVIVGIILGDIVFLLLAISGLTLLARALGSLFIVIKFLGGGYLIWLGIRMFLSTPGFRAATPPIRTTRYGCFFSGFLITLGNPKVILFYCGFLPTFLALEDIVLTDMLIIVIVIAAVLLLVLGCYAWLASSARNALCATTKQSKWLNRTAGGIMMASGAAIISRS